jgi:hypothetical protein
MPRGPKGERRPADGSTSQEAFQLANSRPGVLRAYLRRRETAPHSSRNRGKDGIRARANADFGVEFRADLLTTRVLEVRIRCADAGGHGNGDAATLPSVFQVTQNPQNRSAAARHRIQRRSYS